MFCTRNVNVCNGTTQYIETKTQVVRILKCHPKFNILSVHLW